MIKTGWLRDGEVFAIHPQGPLEEEDFSKVGELIDPLIAERGRLEGLMVDASGFSGWDDAKALIAHLRFVHEHQEKVARIAVLGDHWWLRSAPAMEPFYGTPIRVFGGDEMDKAKDWLLKTPAPVASVTFLPECEGSNIAIKVKGRLRDADYEELQSTLRERISMSGGLRLLVLFDEEFRGWTPKACLDDIAMAFSPWTSRIERLAVVAGPGFVRCFSEHFPAMLLPYDFKVFSPEEFKTAWKWATGRAGGTET